MQYHQSVSLHVSAPLKRGFSLIEAAIVLGIIGLVIGGIWVAAASVQENNRVSRHMEQLVFITQSAQSLFKNQPPYSDGSNPTLISYTDNTAVSVPPSFLIVQRAGWYGVIPDDMIVGTSQMPINPWGNTVALAIAGAYLSVSTLVPVSTCISLAPRLAAATKDLAPTAYAFPGNVLIATSGAPEAAGTVDTAKTACPHGNIASNGLARIFVYISR